MHQNYYTPIGGLGIAHLGQAADDPAAIMEQQRQMNRDRARRFGVGSMVVYSTILFASASASAYHGYKRNRGSTGAAVGWGLLGLIFPIITPAVALAQGFGDPKVSRNRRRRRTSRRRR